MSYDRTNADYEARITSDAAAGFPTTQAPEAPGPPAPPPQKTLRRILDLTKLKRRRDIAELAGTRYGMLLAIRLIPKDEVAKDKAGQRKASWECLCDCGKTTAARADRLRYGLMTHCGCHRKPRAPNKPKPGAEPRAPRQQQAPKETTPAEATEPKPAPPPKLKMTTMEIETLNGQQMAARGVRWREIAEYFSFGANQYTPAEAKHRCESSPALKPLTHPKHATPPA